MAVDIKRVQKRLLEMAKIIARFFEGNNLPYQIAFGTLLGAARYKGFIPWDFEGFKLPIPKNYYSILKTEFGDYMAFPPVEERGHCHD